MLQLVRKFIPIQTKRLLYCAHVYSRINYGLVIWGPMINQASKNKIFQIQKDCICLIFNKPISPHTHPLFRKSQLLKLSELTELELLKITQKHYKQNLPLAIRELVGTKTERVKHRYPIRNRNISNILKHSNDLYNKSFLCKSIIVGQNCVESLKRCESLNILKSIIMQKIFITSNCISLSMFCTF